MKYSLEELIKTIRIARKKKGLSQRELSAKTGIPQSHLSKIENGMVDLKISSLIEMLRVLDLEIMLIHRNLVPTIQGLEMNANEPDPTSNSKTGNRFVHHEEETPSSLPAYQLDKADKEI